MKTRALWQQHVGVPMLRFQIPRAGGVVGMDTCSLPAGVSVAASVMDALSWRDSTAVNAGLVAVLDGAHGLGSNSRGVGSQGLMVII
jgi:hypothetical protein